MIPKTLPKGTTMEQWEQYEKDLAAHESYYSNIRPKTSDFVEFVEWNKALSAWLTDKNMYAPNKPGYYRANND